MLLVIPTGTVGIPTAVHDRFPGVPVDVLLPFDLRVPVTAVGQSPGPPIGLGAIRRRVRVPRPIGRLRKPRPQHTQEHSGQNNYSDTWFHLVILLKVLNSVDQPPEISNGNSPSARRRISKSPRAIAGFLYPLSFILSEGGRGYRSVKRRLAPKEIGMAAVRHRKEYCRLELNLDLTGAMHHDISLPYQKSCALNCRYVVGRCGLV